MRIHDTVVGIVFAVFGIWVLMTSLAYPSLPGQPIGPGTFPSLLGGCFILGGALLAASGLRQKIGHLVLVDIGWRNPARLATAALVIFGTLALSAVFERIGFPIGTMLLIIPLFLLSGLNKWLWPMVAVVFVLGLYWVMSRLLLVPLPDGPLEWIF